MATETAKQEHGPAGAGYDNLGHALYGHSCPFIQCLCGWQTDSSARCWQEVGQQFDEHLAEVEARSWARHRRRRLRERTR